MRVQDSLRQRYNQAYAQLNPDQKLAVDTIEGPVLVIAGPGSGKTQIISLRIANILLKSQSGPENVLALSFTNSACRNMRQRLFDLIGHEALKVRFHTFHSFANEIITTFSEEFSFQKSMDQIDELEQIKLIESILDSEASDYDLIRPFRSPYHWVKKILKLIGQLKREGISAQRFKRSIKAEISEIEQDEQSYNKAGKLKGKQSARINSLKRSAQIAAVYGQYQSRLQALGLYDYEDMLLFTVQALKQNSEIKLHYQEKLQYILVDEFQDSNDSQNEILFLLTDYDAAPNVFAVGDDDQAIFRFQGANIENILQFSKRFPSYQPVVLRLNYRSSANIIRASRSMISHNTVQMAKLANIDKTIKGVAKNGAKIKVRQFNSATDEAYFIYEQIRKARDKGERLADIGVIYRRHDDNLRLKHFLDQDNIAYKEISGNNLLADYEIVKLLNLLKVFSNPRKANDRLDEALFRSLHLTLWRISTNHIYIANRASRKKKCSLSHYIWNIEQFYEHDFTQKPRELIHFSELWRKIVAKQFNLTLSAYFQTIIQESGYYSWLKQEPNSPALLEMVGVLFDELKRQNHRHKTMSLAQFINHLDELEENKLILKYEPLQAEQDCVHLLTVHSAKGLEFDSVYILRASESAWPTKQEREEIALPKNLLPSYSATQVEEEQLRLFYVAMTRAKTKLCICYADQYDNDRQEVASRFISEIDPKTLDYQSTKPDAKKRTGAMMLSLRLAKTQRNTQFEKYLKIILDEFCLSPTALNNYLECPVYFLYNNLLKAPQAKEFQMAYGTAVHNSLEQFFNQYRKNLKLPSKQELVDNFREYIAKEVLTLSELNLATTNGVQNLSDYYDFHQSQWHKAGPPLYCEYSFIKGTVALDDIHLSGKIDKIELLDPIAKTLRVVDYKTSKPKSENFIRGLTADKNRGLLNQLLFYKLLCELDPNFTAGVVRETSLDFISPQNDKFVLRTIVPKQQEVEELKQIIRTVMQKIRNFEFRHESIEAKQNCQYCQSGKFSFWE